MSQSLEHAIVLFNQGLFDLAVNKFRQHLSDDPEDPYAHALLSLSLSQLDKHDEALFEADEATRCDPELAVGHYARGWALLEKKRLAQAEQAAVEAMQLDPADVQNVYLVTAIAMARRDWKKALESAEHGLELDPEHTGCRNMKAMALTQLGRKAEAALTLGDALAHDPNNAYTHANQGWTLLQQGDHAKALEHFREALRIDPDNEWARTGVVESLKARYFVYRIMLQFFFWMGRKSAAAQIAVVVMFMFGRQFLNGLAKQNPALAPFIEPILILTFVFLLLTWTADSLFNITLRFNKFGRLALSKDQTLASNLIGPCVFAAVISWAIFLFNGSLYFQLSMLYFAFLLFPLGVTFRSEPGTKPRRYFAIYTTAIAILGLVAVFPLVPVNTIMSEVTALKLAKYFFYGSILSTWFGVLGNRELLNR